MESPFLHTAAYNVVCDHFNTDFMQENTTLFMENSQDKWLTKVMLESWGCGLYSSLYGI